MGGTDQLNADFHGQSFGGRLEAGHDGLAHGQAGVFGPDPIVEGATVDVLQHGVRLVVTFPHIETALDVRVAQRLGQIRLAPPAPCGTAWPASSVASP